MASRGASLLAHTLFLTVILFAGLYALSSSSLLAKFSYKTESGWYFYPPDDGPPYGVCEKTVFNKGFPLVSRQPEYQDPRCYAKNTLAEGIDAALCLAVATAVAVPVARIFKGRYE